MSDATVKLQVLSWLIGSEGLISIPEGVKKTGASRQLVKHHVDKFVNQGYVELIKNDYNGHVRFMVIDKTKLVMEASVAADNASLGSNKAFNTVTLDKYGPAKLNSLIIVIKQARALGLNNSLELRNALIGDLGKSINSLRNAKRGLTEGNYTTKNTRKNVSKDESSYFQDYCSILVDFRIPHDKTEVERELSQALIVPVSENEEEEDE
jgi:hypothetical protein